MENKKEIALNEFLSKDNDVSYEEIENNETIKIKDNNSIIERVDKIIIVENGKQLLREVY